VRDERIFGKQVETPAVYKMNREAIF